MSCLVSFQNLPVFVCVFYVLGQATGNARCCLYVVILFTLCYLLLSRLRRLRFDATF